jgi:hypothetical protein
MYFCWLVDVLMLRRLGLAKPFRYILLVLFAGCLVAGMIYAVVVFHALEERSQTPHVHAHSPH